MKNLLEYLLLEKENESTGELDSIASEDWNALQSISPGPISMEVRKLLNIKSAKDAKIVSTNQTSKAIKDPANFRKDLNISQTEDFEKLMKSILRSTDEFRVFFSSVKIMKHFQRGKVAKISLSKSGKDIISADTQLIRFYKFWFDSIIHACLMDGKRKRREKYLRYRKDGKSIYVWYGKA